MAKIFPKNINIFKKELFCWRMPFLAEQEWHESIAVMYRLPP